MDACAAAALVATSKGHDEQQPDTVTEPGGGPPPGTVQMDGLLQLWPAQLETQLWQSPSAVRLMRRLDWCCLTNSVFISGLLLRSFGAPMSWSERLQAALYPVMSVVQLAVMFWHKDLYQRHRFKLTVFNRTLRLLTAVLAAVGMDSHNFQRFLDNTTFGYSGALPMRPYVSLLRFVVGVPLFWSVHANFVLPFAYVLVAQAITAGMMCYGLRASVCVMLSYPGVAQAVQPMCQVLKVSMHYFGLVLEPRPPHHATGAAGLECAGIEGFLLLCVYANMLVLLVGPCLTVYFIELNLKMGFLKQQGLTLQHAPPCLGSRLCQLVVVYGAVVGAWMACEVAVLTATPLQCDASGMLVRA